MYIYTYVSVISYYETNLTKTEWLTKTTNYYFPWFCGLVWLDWWLFCSMCRWTDSSLRSASRWEHSWDIRDGLPSGGSLSMWPFSCTASLHRGSWL